MSKLAKAMQAAAGNAGGANEYIEDVFSTYLYTGTGGVTDGIEQTINNGIDLATEGGLVWIKTRSGIDSPHIWDTERGVLKKIDTNSTDAEISSARSLMAFNDNGFSIGRSSAVNESGVTHASWTFRKAPKFFDVVTYTGNGVAGREIAHDLGSTVGTLIIKKTSGNDQWRVWHRSRPNANIQLNQTDAENTSNTKYYFGDGTNVVTPTSTEFTVQALNENGFTYVAYLFAHDAGGFGDDGEQNVVSCGSYTGNSSSTGPVVNLGWEPQWVMVKNASSTGDWSIFDNMRGMPATANATQRLKPNTADAESAIGGFYPTATGFEIKDTTPSINASPDTFIYIAIRRGPMKTPESGTEVFATDTAGGTLPNPPLYNSGWPVDLGWYRGNMPSPASNDWYDRLRGQTQTLFTSSTSKEEPFGGGNYSFDSNTGWSTQSFVQADYRSWMFRRAPGFFDVVAYTGTGTSSIQSVNHNLGIVPEMIIIKSRSNGSTNWLSFISKAPIASNYYGVRLNTTGANAVSVGSNSFTDTTFSAFSNSFLALSSADNQTASGATYIAYLFATCPGVSKVGSYTGTGTTLAIDCGFSAGARFVLIKRTDSTGDWYVWDTARGIVAGNDPYLLLNSTAAEVTNTDYIDPSSAGFEISSTAPVAINASGGSYIFLAIA